MATPHTTYPTVESDGKTWLVLQNADVAAPPPPRMRTRLYSYQEYLVGHVKTFDGFAAYATSSAPQGVAPLPPDEVRIDEDEFDRVSGAASPRAPALSAQCGSVDQGHDVCCSMLNLTADLEKVADEAEPHEIDEIDAFRAKYATAWASYLAPKRGSPALRVNQGTPWDCALCHIKVNGQTDARHHIDNKHMPGRYKVDAICYRQKRKALRQTQQVPEDMMKNGDDWRSFYLKCYEVLWGLCFPGKNDRSGRYLELSLIDGISRRDVNRLCYVLLERYQEIHRLSVTHDVAPRRRYGLSIDISQLRVDHSASTYFMDDLLACEPCLCRLDELEHSMGAQEVHFYRDQRPFAELANDSANEVVTSRAFFTPETTSRNMTQYLDCVEPADGEDFEKASIAPVNSSIPNEHEASASASEEVQPAPVRQESEVEDLQLIEAEPSFAGPEQIVSESIVKPSSLNSSEAPANCSSRLAQLLEVHPVVGISQNTIHDKASCEAPDVVKEEAISTEDFTDEPVERDPEFYNVSLKRSWSSLVGFASQMENLLDRSPALGSEFPEMALLLQMNNNWPLDDFVRGGLADEAPTDEDDEYHAAFDDIVEAGIRGEFPDNAEVEPGFDDRLDEIKNPLCETTAENINTKEPKTRKRKSTSRGRVHCTVDACNKSRKRFISIGQAVEHIVAAHAKELPKIWRCRLCSSFRSFYKANVAKHVRTLHKQESMRPSYFLERWHHTTIKRAREIAPIYFPQIVDRVEKFLIWKVKCGLYEEWEENDDEKTDEQEVPVDKPSALDLEQLKAQAKDPEDLLKLTKKGQTLMMFVGVVDPDRPQVKDIRPFTDKMTSLWHTSLYNNHIDVQVYVVDDNRAIFMFKDGSQAFEAKQFLLKQPQVYEVTLEGRQFPGSGAKHLKSEL
ncbi:unnamed protein product, partial [Mesorhabditis spiculigera]